MLLWYVSLFLYCTRGSRPPFLIEIVLNSLQNLCYLFVSYLWKSNYLIYIPKYAYLYYSVDRINVLFALLWYVLLFFDYTRGSRPPFLIEIVSNLSQNLLVQVYICFLIFSWACLHKKRIKLPKVSFCSCLFGLKNLIVDQQVFAVVWKSYTVESCYSDHICAEPIWSL